MPYKTTVRIQSSSQKQHINILREISNYLKNDDMMHLYVNMRERESDTYLIVDSNNTGDITEIINRYKLEVVEPYVWLDGYRVFVFVKGMDFDVLDLFCGFLRWR